MKNMPEAKKRKFEQTEIAIDDFIERQLNDTRYICVEVKDYLRQLGVPVEVSKGVATADLRYLWQLNRVLNPESHNSKNREDHRHHAIDAIVIALTDRRLFQMLSHLSSKSNGASLTERGFQLQPPWSNLIADTKYSIEAIVVSHASSRKIYGALHEETAYGLVGQPDRNGKAEFVVRKDLSTFDKLKQLEAIKDHEVRRLALTRLEECGGSFKTAFRNPDNPLLHRDGITPIKTVRVSVVFDRNRMVEIKDKAGTAFKYYPMGSNHHVEILENQDGLKWKGVFVPTIEAARRAKAGEPVFQRDHGPDWKYVMSLCANDLVELENNGVRKLYRVQKMSDPNVDFRLHTAAVLNLENAEPEMQKAYEANTHLRSSINPLKSLKPRKVIVSPIGDLKDADD